MTDTNPEEITHSANGCSVQVGLPFGKPCPNEVVYTEVVEHENLDMVCEYGYCEEHKPE